MSVCFSVMSPQESHPFNNPRDFFYVRSLPPRRLPLGPTSTQDHYFTAEPASPAQQRTITVLLAGRRSPSAPPPESQPRRGGPGDGRPLRRARATRFGQPAGPRLWLGTDRPHPCAPVTRRDRVCRGRQRARAGPAPHDGDLAGARPGAREPAGRHTRGRAVRRDLVEPADPGGQGGAARADAQVAAPAGAGRGRPPRRAEEPRLGLAAALAHRAADASSLTVARFTSDRGFRILEVRRAS